MQKDIKDKNTINENKKVKKDHKEQKEEKIELTKEEVFAMNEKIKNAEEKVLRSNAELVNYRKRKDEEVQKLLKYANEDLIIELLPTIDNFERAIKMENTDSKLLDGMKMVYNSLVSTLEKYGVKEIESLDKKFDPNFHNAVITDSVKEKESEIILEVMQKGYTLKDKVIRPAMVKVNK